MQDIVSVIADLLKLAFSFVISTLKNHWTKFILSGFLTIAFLVLLFPYGDLTSLLSRQIYENTGIGTQIGNLSLGFMPGPGIELSKLEVEVASPPLTVGAARISPSLLSSLINTDLFFSAEVDDTFGGNISVQRSSGNKVPEQDYNMEAIDLSFEGVSIDSVLKTLSNLTVGPKMALPIKLSGNLSLDSQMQVDPQLNVQPEVELNIKGKNIVFPPQSVPTQMGPLSFPKMTMANVRIKGRLVGGELIIEEGELGNGKDPLILKIKGKIDLALRKRGPNVTPSPGPYEFYVDLKMLPSVDSVIGLLLTPIAGNYKIARRDGPGSRYLFRASSNRFGALPSTRSTNPF